MLLPLLPFEKVRGGGFPMTIPEKFYPLTLGLDHPHSIYMGSWNQLLAAQVTVPNITKGYSKPCLRPNLSLASPRTNCSPVKILNWGIQFWLQSPKSLRVFDRDMHCTMLGMDCLQTSGLPYVFTWPYWAAALATKLTISLQYLLTVYYVSGTGRSSLMKVIVTSPLPFPQPIRYNQTLLHSLAAWDPGSRSSRASSPISFNYLIFSFHTCPTNSQP